MGCAAVEGREDGHLDSGQHSGDPDQARKQSGQHNRNSKKRERWQEDGGSHTSGGERTDYASTSKHHGERHKDESSKKPRANVCSAGQRSDRMGNEGIDEADKLIQELLM